MVSTLRTRATSYACGLWHTYRHWRYALLFYSILLTLAVVPLRRALGFHTNLLELCLAINLLAAVVPIGDRKTRRVLTILMGRRRRQRLRRSCSQLAGFQSIG